MARKLAVIEFLTLDGVMQGFGSPDEDRDGGFEHGGWGDGYLDEQMGASAAEGMRTTSAYLFGRRTYGKMAAHWPNEPADNPMAAHLNATPKYVASRTLRQLDWANSSVLEGELPVAVDELKSAGEGTIAVLGSGVLVQQLIAYDLVDQYRLFLHPLILGSGKRLFSEISGPRRLRLLDCTPTGTGVVILSYAVA